MNDENHGTVARTPVKKGSESVHQQLRARRFLGTNTSGSTVTTTTVPAASTPIDPVKSRPVRRFHEDHRVTETALDLQSAFMNEQLHLSESPHREAVPSVAVAKKAARVELAPARVSVTRSEEMALVEGPASPGGQSNVPLAVVSGSDMCELAHELAETSGAEEKEQKASGCGDKDEDSSLTAADYTDRSVDALCASDATPLSDSSPQALGAAVPISAATPAAGPVRHVSSPKMMSAAALVSARTPSVASSCLPSDEEDEDKEAESGHGSVRDHVEVSSVKEVTVTPQRQRTSTARSAPSPSLALDNEAGVMPTMVTCTPVKAGSTALLLTSDDGSSNACRPLSSSFGIRPKATKRFDFVRAFEPLPTTPEKTGPRFARGSAVEYQLACPTSAATTATGAKCGQITMREERWKDIERPSAKAPPPPPPPPPPLPRAVTSEGSGAFQRATHTTSHHSSAEEKPPRGALYRTERRGSLMQVREKSPGRQGDGQGTGGAHLPAKKAPTEATEPLLEGGDEPVAGDAAAPQPPAFSSEQVSPASPRTLPSTQLSGSLRAVTGSGSAFSTSPSPDAITAEKAENFHLYRKRSFCLYGDSDVYEATNSAFQGGAMRTTKPRSAMPYDPPSERQRRAQEAASRQAHGYNDEDTTSTASSTSCTDSDLENEAVDTRPLHQTTADGNSTHTQLPGVDSTSMSSFSNGKHADSTGRPTTGGGATTRGVSSSNGCTTDDRPSHSTSREYEEDDGEAGTSPPANAATAHPELSGCLGLAAVSESDNDDSSEGVALVLATSAFRFPPNQDDIVELSAITFASLDGDDVNSAAVASTSYENFLKATAAPLAAFRLDGGAGSRRASSALAERAQALMREIEVDYEALLAEHREGVLDSFLTLTERCLATQKHLKEKKMAAIFGAKEWLPAAIALPTSPRLSASAPPTPTTVDHAAPGSFSHAGPPREGFASMERHTPASPYVCTATTVFGMALRTSLPPSAPRSRRTSGDENGGLTMSAIHVGRDSSIGHGPLPASHPPQSPLTRAPTLLPKITPVYDAYAATEAILSSPFKSPLKLIFSLSTSHHVADEKTDTVMRSLLGVYFDYHLEEHLRRVQHALFDFAYYVMVAVPGLRMLETHERRLICMARDLLIRDRIELFMLTLPSDARARSGSRTGGAVKLGGCAPSESGSHAGSGSGGLMSNFLAAYKTSMSQKLTSCKQEKERRVVQRTGKRTSTRQPLCATSAAAAPLRAVEEYAAGTGSRPGTAPSMRLPESRPRAASASATSAQVLSAQSSAPRQFPSPAQIAGAATPASTAPSATKTPTTTPAEEGESAPKTISSRTQRVALPTRSASLPTLRKKVSQQPQKSFFSLKPIGGTVRGLASEETESEAPRTVMVLSRGAPVTCQDGDHRTYRRISGEITREDGTSLMRAQERIHPGPRLRTPPPPATENQFMNLANLDPR